VPEVERRWKKRLLIEVLPWDGVNGAQVGEFTGNRVNFSDRGSRIEVWNDQEAAWIAVPPGHYVAKGALGELYPLSPSAYRDTTEPEFAERPEDPDAGGFAEGTGEREACALLLEKAQEAVAFERKRADMAEAALADLALRLRGELDRGAAAGRDRALAVAEGLKTRLARPGNGPGQWTETDVVPLAALREALAPQSAREQSQQGGS
jgi:hypothetical protein